METTLLIEAEGQPSVTITIEAAPEIIFQDTGVQGPPGEVEEGDAIRIIGPVVHVDINRLSFAP